MARRADKVIVENASLYAIVGYGGYGAAYVAVFRIIEGYEFPQRIEYFETLANGATKAARKQLKISAEQLTCA